ncbi:hypothetical protein SISSUDRAFT_728102 [Sistotremastrum suecicum HHB10207 ss-3]|uniref:Arrestin-like N-terminal domain-containing protein n=1 Tax=Sistotremastrum suecicum HHB10207 ss-3 TaxID=1314776 RepID=A0A166DKB5_9AGAM|nr:hypothetical protein SISSUDRAFT_728102 [Sistotremastrum suecicum HHB10207 ss-3]
MSAAIQYYVMILGKKEAWYKSNVRIVKPFMFLPFDQSSPPSALSSAGRIWKKEIAIKRGVLFGAAGKVEAEVVLPDVPSLPLFHPIPIYIRIKCYSKPLPHTESSDPSSFKFPLPPTTTTGLDLKLCSHIRISAKGHVRERPLDYASVAGLGKPEKKTQAGGWGQDVQVDVGQPTWVMEGESKKMGRWFQESTFQAPMTLRCPPSFDRRTVRLEYTFELTVPFPGLGNNLTLSVGPVPVSSGIYRDQIERAAGELLDLPPTYWEVAELKEK